MNQNNSRFISLAIFTLGLFILVFLTKSFYFDLQQTRDENTLLVTSLGEKQAEEQKLKDIKTKVNSGKDTQVEKYIFDFKEDEIIKYIYGYIQNSKINGSYVAITKSLSMTQGSINEYGFKEGTIQIELRVASEEAMMSFIDYLTADNAKYQFFIDSFTYPNDSASLGTFNVSIPVKVFYK